LAVIERWISTLRLQEAAISLTKTQKRDKVVAKSRARKAAGACKPAKAGSIGEAEYQKLRKDGLDRFPKILARLAE
jgi:hypothetical protein